MIKESCNTSEASYSYFGGTFELPPGMVRGTIEADKYLAGDRNFKVSEIEVFII